MAGIVPLTNAAANLRAEGDRVEIRGLRASVYQGSLTGDVTVTLDAKRIPTYEVAMKAKDWEANDFLSDLTPAKNILYGKFEMDSKWSGRGVLPEDALKNLKGSGKATTLNGELRNLEALNAVANLLGMNELKQQKFRSMFTNFEVKDGKLHTDEIVMKSADADWRATGGVSFAGNLDYVISATLSPTLSQKLKQKSALTGLLANSEGRIVLDFVVKGDAKKPKVSYDPTKSAAANSSNAIGTILESVDKDGQITGAINELLQGDPKDAGKTVDKLLGGFLNKKKPADPKPAPASPDSAKKPQ
ncbi:MAG: AsmA-like C-terminal region-containing protein [Gemmatimonadetes bacterium]|nr:AsmA-like C-terminal region-containing protein [Gemmatimonadota bacterium]